MAKARAPRSKPLRQGTHEVRAGAKRATTAPRPKPDYEAPEYKALKRAVKEGDVSFHQVATAWFNSHFGGERCPDCDGRGTLLSPQLTGSGAVVTPSADAPQCPACHGIGTMRDEARALAYDEILPDLMRVFGDQRGGVITAYFCKNIRVAAALTDIWSAADRADGRIRSMKQVRAEEEAEKKRLASMNWVQRRWEAFRRRLPRPGGLREHASNTAIHLEPIFGDPDSPQAKRILFRCLKVHYLALEYLKPKPRKICMRRTFNVITALLGTLDSRAGRGEPASAFEGSYDDQKALNDELLSTEEYYRSSAERTARLQYLGGMLIGVPFAAVVAIILNNQNWAPRDMAICFAAGALGALVSVMERLTAGKLELNHEVGGLTIAILGFIRPLFGALFGLALFFFISGGVLDINLPDGEATERYFFASIAFLAGFSERLARDVIDPSRVKGIVPQADPTAVR